MKATTILVILSIAVSRDWLIQQIDVNNNFLHGSLEETVYMLQLIGFNVAPSKLYCKLQKSFYGPKLAPLVWFHGVSSSFLTSGFIGLKFIYPHLTTIIYVQNYVDEYWSQELTWKQYLFYLNSLITHDQALFEDEIKRFNLQASI